MDLGTAIKEIRKEKGISQKDLAPECGLSVNALYNIEKNITNPPKNTLNKICEALGVPAAYLFFLSITDEDIPEEKKDVFNALYKSSRDVLLEAISKESL